MSERAFIPLRLAILTVSDSRTPATDRSGDLLATRLTEAGLSASGMVRHGNVADTLNAIAVEEGATQIVVARSTEGGFTKRIFGSATANLVMEASVPVTVVT